MPKSSESSTRGTRSVRTAPYKIPEPPRLVTGMPSFNKEEEEGEGKGEVGTSVTSVTSGTMRTSVRAPLGRMPSLVANPSASDSHLYSSLKHDPRKINTGTHTFHELVTALNAMLKNGKSNIEWVPDEKEIKIKSDGSPSKDYLIRSTDYNYWDLLKLRDEIKAWIQIKKGMIGRTMKVLVVDVANSVSAIKEAIGRERPLDELYTMLNRISSENGCNVIILCIQNHYIGKPKYRDFIRYLRGIFGNNIFIITAHNRSSSDDLNGVLTIEILRDLYIEYNFLTGDYLMDYRLRLRDGTLVPIMLIREIDENVIDPKVLLGKKTTEQRNTDLENHFRKFEERERRTRGGTNKNNYTRKIKNSKKVKTLHKKRNTSKKVLKKYNKNYKKKTLRRKNK